MLPRNNMGIAPVHSQMDTTPIRSHRIIPPGRMRHCYP
jgi:hypothetical protein